VAFSYIIPTQNFERIRDAIAAIIVAEFAGQYALTSNALFQSKVWIERFVPFDISELPAILVTLDLISEVQSNPGRSVYQMTLQVQVYTWANDTDSVGGDENSALNNHKLVGVLRYIFRNPTYVRASLDSSPLTIQTIQVSEIQFVKPDFQDSNHTFASQLTLNIRYDESNGTIVPIDFETVTTQVKLAETDKGYYLELNT
jgi:hypothetical protein